MDLKNQINKTNLIILSIGLLIGIAIMYIFQKPTIVEVEVPFEVSVQLPAITNTIKGDPYPVPYNVKVEVENPLNLKLKTQFEKANDSIKKLLFIMAIAQKEYNINYKDTIQSIDVYSKIVNGEISNQSITYNIFAKTKVIKGKVKVPIPVYNKLYYGFEASNPINGNITPSFGAGILLQTKKDNIWKVSFDTKEQLTLSHYVKF